MSTDTLCLYLLFYLIPSRQRLQRDNNFGILIVATNVSNVKPEDLLKVVHFIHDLEHVLHHAFELF